MIEAIGCMIGTYIITRMVSFLTREGERAETAIVKIFSVITIVVTVVLMVYLIITGMKNPG
ncbi:MAG: hypothetical protein PHW46_03870 [Candidatus Omnitrophica bacterium]|nr:hypothetical protein [Candidatus Omnitrophota bacterium]